MIRPSSQEHGAICERQRVDAIVAHDVCRDGQKVNQRPELLAHFVAGRAVERGERLVKQKEPGPPEHCPRQRHALLLSSGQLARQAALEAAELKCAEQLGNAQRRRALSQPARRERDVLLDCQVRKQGVVLEEHADVAAIGREVHSARRVKPDTIAEAHMASLRPLETGETSQHGGLARSRGPQKHRHSRLSNGILPAALYAGTIRIPERDIHVEERHSGTTRRCSE